MELGEGFDPFSSVQPVADWFNPPYGHVETVKALDLYKKVSGPTIPMLLQPHITHKCNTQRPQVSEM